MQISQNKYDKLKKQAKLKMTAIEEVNLTVGVVLGIVMTILANKLFF